MADRAFLLCGSVEGRGVGIVQGRGVRPAIAREARRLGVNGYVYNCDQGVVVVACGMAETIQPFEVWLRAQFAVRPLPIPRIGLQTGFQILQSSTGLSLRTNVPVDTAVCPSCIEEILSDDSRRHHYLFNSCVQCGPRYSIIDRMPFDRERTTMSDFTLCEICSREIGDENDRRFHGQTISCANCGPSAWLMDQSGQTIAFDRDAIETLTAALGEGRLVSIKGVGGYQLLCDASNDEAVARLRQRKGRPRKPLAVMVGKLALAHEIGIVHLTDEQELTSPENPIVLVRSRKSCKVSRLVHPDLQEIGILLPTTPLHWLIADRFPTPIVVTSGNVSGSPIAAESGEIHSHCVADVTLHHNRVISRPIDDSVTCRLGSQRIILRAARGFTPHAWPIVSGPVDSGPIVSGPSLLALGGHQNVALGIRTEQALVLGPHIGDMDTEASRNRLIHSIQQITELYDLNPMAIVSDLHPDYFTTRLASERGLPHIQVQHHHAHIAAAMLDAELLDQEVLGFAMDGTGYGSDGSIWGGEVLRCTAAEYRRVAHLRPFPLPGAERAIHQPWRTALALLDQCGATEAIEQLLVRVAPATPVSLFRRTLPTAPRTTSMGRLFDGLASMILNLREATYEGEAAMMLEAICDPCERGEYRFAFTDQKPIVIDWRPIIEGVLADLGIIGPERIAMKFHRAVAKMILHLAECWPDLPALLGGGVFQNRVLLELIMEESVKRNRSIMFPKRLPIGDGGLAIGQLVIASAILQTNQPPQSDRTEDPQTCA